jgi:hypothetical protein
LEKEIRYAESAENGENKKNESSKYLKTIVFCKILNFYSEKQK